MTKLDAAGLAQIINQPEHYTVYAESRDKLIEFSDSHIENWSANPEINYIYMQIYCSCGKQYVYKTREDIPYESVDCPCGQHIITYGPGAA